MRLRCDHGKTAVDLFTAAMNMILPYFKRPACFSIYMVCYFHEVSGEGDVLTCLVWHHGMCSWTGSKR